MVIATLQLSGLAGDGEPIEPPPLPPPGEQLAVNASVDEAVTQSSLVLQRDTATSSSKLVPEGVAVHITRLKTEDYTTNETLALHAKKIGHTLYPGKTYCGKIIVVDIGISKKFNNYIQ